jgi:nucleotide-binding universal stress UspA family protein
MRTLQRLADLADDAGLDTRPQLYAEFKSARPVSEKILETAGKLRADLIIMGLHSSVYTGVISHIGSATAYEVVCRASCPFTVSCSSVSPEIRPTQTEVTASPLSEADVIRIHGFGAKW